MEAFVKAMKESRASVSPADKILVTLSEAVELGFSREWLREAIREGKIQNVGTPHRYRLRVRDLKAL